MGYCPIYLGIYLGSGRDIDDLGSRSNLKYIINYFSSPCVYFWRKRDARRGRIKCGPQVHRFRLPEASNLHFLVPGRSATDQWPRGHYNRGQRQSQKLIIRFRLQFVATTHQRWFFFALFDSQRAGSQSKIFGEILLCPRQFEAGLNQRSRNIGWVRIIEDQNQNL